MTGQFVMQVLGDAALSGAILETVRLPLLVLDADLRVVSVNDAFLDQFRVTRDSTVGRRVYDLAGGQWNIPRLRMLLEDVLTRKQSSDDHEVVHAFPDLGERVLVMNGRRMDQGGPILLAIRDVTEDRETAARLRDVAKAAQIGVFEIDAPSGARFWSREMREIVGYPLDDPAPPAGVVPDFIHPDDRENVADTLRRVHDPQGDGNLFHEHRIVLADGTVRWVQLHGRTEFFGDGGAARTSRLRGVLLDVTERKTAEARLHDSETRQAFLLELGDTLRPLADPSEIIATATRLLERRLEATRAYFVEWRSDEDAGVVTPDPAVPGGPGQPGRYAPWVARSPWDRLARGGTWVVADAAAAPDLEDDEAQHFRDTGIAAWIDVPLVKDGRLRATLRVVQDRARRWTDTEVALAEETADRCWAAVERGRAEAALRASESKYRSLFEAIDAGFCVNEFRFDPVDGRADYRVVEANPAFYKQTGFPKEILGRWLRDAAPDLEEHWYEIYGRVARTRQPTRFEQKSDMLGRWFDVYAFPIGETEDLGIAVLFSDISQRKRSEEALRNSEARYHALFERAVEGIWLAAPDGRFVDVNPAACAMLGYGRDEMLRLSVRDLLRPEDIPRLREVMRAVEAGDTPTWVWEMLRADGAWIPLELSHSTTPDGHWQAIGRDISERRLSEERQNMLMAELDHRVKNILAVVQSIARQSLRAGGRADSEAAQQLVGRIDALARSHSLLARSRWDGARFRDLVDDAIAPYRGERAGRIVAEGPDLSVSPKAAQTLTLALHELVTNAAKYGSLSAEHGRVTAEWRIDGTGDDRRLVFTWIERGGPPIEAPPDRKGFGSLLIERTLAFELEGKVDLDFAPEGLRATIDLPLGRLRVSSTTRPDDRAQGARKAAGAAGALRDRRVLVVEDEHLVGEETAEALRAAGCVVRGPVGALPEALAIAVSEDLDAAIVDINLAGVPVWPVARALRARGIPLVLGTGYSDTFETPADLADVRRLEKPFDRARLLTALSETVAAQG